MMAALLTVLLAALPTDPLVPGAPGLLSGHRDTVTALAYSADGQWLATASRDTSIRIWNASTGAQTASIATDRTQINALAFSPDGTLLATGNVELQIRLLDVATGAVKRVIAYPDSVLELVFSPDGARLVAAGPTGTVGVYSVADGKPVLTGLRGQSVRFSGDGGTLALGQVAGGITLVDAKTGKAKKTIATTGHSPTLTMSTDAKLLATWNAKERGIRLWSGVTLKSLGELASPKPKDAADLATADTITSLAMTGDGALVVSAAATKVIRVWSTATQKVVGLHPLEHHGIVVVSPDGKTVAVADGTRIKVWALSEAK